MRDLGQSMGLILNVEKCEIIAHPGLCVDDTFLLSFQHVLPKNPILLGAPYHKDKHWTQHGRTDVMI